MKETFYKIEVMIMSKCSLTYKGIELYVADTYDNGYKPYSDIYEENNKLYVNMKKSCSRCGGAGWVIRPDYICFRCNGGKWETKKVRLYTEKEYGSYEKAKAAAEARKQRERDARHQKMKDEFKTKHGFNSNDDSYLYYGETYAIKDMLKANGAIFDCIFGWHSPNPIEVPEGTFVTILNFYDIYDLDDSVDMYCLLPDAKERIEKATRVVDEEFASSEYIGVVGEKIEAEVEVSSISGYSSRFGDGHVYVFNSNGNKLVWFTTSIPNIDSDMKFTITATVKKHDEYKGIKQTTVTRVKVI